MEEVVEGVVEGVVEEVVVEEVVVEEVVVGEVVEGMTEVTKATMIQVVQPKQQSKENPLHCGTWYRHRWA